MARWTEDLTLDLAPGEMLESVALASAKFDFGQAEVIAYSFLNISTPGGLRKPWAATDTHLTVGYSISRHRRGPILSAD